MGFQEPTAEQKAMLGHQVRVTNPTTGDVWEGKAIAIAMQPSIIVEPRGRASRLALPLTWAEPLDSPGES
jgi:hypothetical protein